MFSRLFFLTVDNFNDKAENFYSSFFLKTHEKSGQSVCWVPKLVPKVREVHVFQLCNGYATWSRDRNQSLSSKVRRLFFHLKRVVHGRHGLWHGARCASSRGSPGYSVEPSVLARAQNCLAPQISMVRTRVLELQKARKSIHQLTIITITYVFKYEYQVGIPMIQNMFFEQISWNSSKQNHGLKRPPGQKSPGLAGPFFGSGSGAGAVSFGAGAAGGAGGAAAGGSSGAALER